MADSVSADAGQPSAGLYCYREITRPCAADCMAYLPQVPSGQAYVGAQWAHCKLLVDSDKVARHLVIIADTMKTTRAESLRSQKPAGA